MNNLFSMFTGDVKTAAVAAGVDPNDFMGPTQPKKTPTKKKSLWENIFGTAQAVARGAGMAMPMDTELASLRGKRATLSHLSYQMADILRQAVPRISARRTAAAEGYAATLKKTANQAKAQATAATRLIDAAIRDGETAQEKMRYGTAALKPSATFFSKKAVADQTFSLAKNRMELVASSWQSMERRLMADTPLPSGVVQAARESVVEFGGKVSRGMVRFGKIAEETAESAAKGGEQYAYLAKYAIPIGIGVVALYAISMGRSTGAGVGRAFESVGSGFGETVRSYRRRK